MKIQIILYLKILFLILFFKELYLTPFKHKKDKYIWFLIVFVFTHFGYSFYLAFRRRLVKKRKFQPDFSKCLYKKDKMI